VDKAVEEAGFVLERIDKRCVPLENLETSERMELILLS